MRNIIKQAAYPLLFASMVLFGLANRAEGMWLNWLAAAVMVVGMVLFVLSAIFPPDGKESPSSAPRGAGTWKSMLGGGAFSGNPAWASAPQLPDEMPAWAYLLCGAISAAGAAAFLLGPNGVSPYTVTSFAMIPGGVVLFFIIKMIYGGARAVSNVILSVMSVAGFLLILGAILTGVLFIAGAFDDGAARWLLAAGGALPAGLVMVYYGMKYQQSSEGVAIGRALGFSDAEGGLAGRDGAYDSKGVVNGVELMFNVEQEPAQHSRHGSRPARFRLEVLCRCANPQGVRLEVRPDGFLQFSLSGLPKAYPPEYWEGYDVRTNLPDVVYPRLVAMRPQASVFNEPSGFEGMSLEGREFRFAFDVTGHASTAFVRAVLGDASRLAAVFS